MQVFQDETKGEETEMIYVDNIVTIPQAVARFHRSGNRWCHMWCDKGDEKQLHKVAHAIGLKTSWFDNDSFHPHYDLTPPKRELALRQNSVRSMSYREWSRLQERKQK